MGIDTRQQQTLGAAPGPSRSVSERSSSPRATRGSPAADYHGGGTTPFESASSIPSSSASPSHRLQRATRESLETLGTAFSRARLSPKSSIRRDLPEQTHQSEHQEQQWWESVLPPGQLAERLRRAQKSASSSSSLRPTPSSSSRASPRSIPATPNNELTDNGRSHHKSTRAFPSRSSAHSDSKRSPKMRSMTTMTSTAAAQEPATSFSNDRMRTMSQPVSARSSFSHSDMTSAASSSGNEDSPPLVRSPSLLSDGWATKYFSGLSHSHSTGGISRIASGPSSTSGLKSPPNGQISRSRSSRRSRVLSDNGHGLGLSVGRDDGTYLRNAMEDHLADWRDSHAFYQTAGSVPMTQTSSSQSSYYGGSLRSSTRSGSGFSFSNAFEDTPGASSEEEHKRDVKTPRPNSASRQSSRRASADLLTGTFPRRSSLRDTNVERPVVQTQADHPPRSRHVSFFPSVELVEGNNDVHLRSLGRGSASSSASPVQHEQPSKRARPHVQSALQFPGKGDDTADTHLHAHFHARGQRLQSYSAPTSPEHAFGTFPKVRRTGARSSKATISRSTEDLQTHQMAQRAAKDDEDAIKSSAAEMALLSSLGAAQAQFASARNLAGALTRQLSAPLRPMLHVTLFLSISTMAFFALSGFLVAGYLATAWDDVNSHGRALQKNVSNASEGVKSRMRWTQRLLGMGSADGATEPTTSSDGNAKDAPTAKEAETASGPMPAFWRFTVALPSAVAYAVTPSVVMDALGGNSASGFDAKSGRSRKKEAKSRTRASNASDEERSRERDSTGYNAMPPRPPLSSLLPSIALTIVIALGAGLASFFASRGTTATAPPAANGNSSGPASPSPRAGTFPHDARSLGSSPFLHARSASLHGKSKSSATGGDAGSRSFRSGARRAQSTYGAASAALHPNVRQEHGASYDELYTHNHRPSTHHQRHSPLLSGRRSPLSQL